MVLVLTLLFAGLAVALLARRKQYARLLGMDPEAKGWRKAAYLWGYVLVPLIFLAALLAVAVRQA